MMAASATMLEKLATFWIEILRIVEGGSSTGSTETLLWLTISSKFFCEVQFCTFDFVRIRVCSRSKLSYHFLTGRTELQIEPGALWPRAEQGINLLE